MIELMVEDYCHDCAGFEPKVENSDNYVVDEFGLPIVGNKLIFCRYRKRCVNMVRYLERKLKSNEG